MSVPVPENIKKDPPAFDVWVEFIGYVREPARLPGRPARVIEGNIYHVSGMDELITLTTQRLASIGFQRGLMVIKPEYEGKTLNVQQLQSPEYRRFVPLDNLDYIDTVFKPMTELPRVEEPGVPLTGQGSLETVEHKPS